MKKVLFLFLILSSFTAKAQFFNNVNNELCYPLREKSDALGKYIVYMVIDEESIKISDTAIFANWNTIPAFVQEKALKRWLQASKRIETERLPCIMRPPIFPNFRYVVPQRVKNSDINWKQWEDGKKFWQYKDKPF